MPDDKEYLETTSSADKEDKEKTDGLSDPGCT